jgi:hypothetical protein
LIAVERPRPRLVSWPSGALRSSAAMRQSSRQYLSQYLRPIRPKSG